MLDAVLDLSHHNRIESFWQIQRSGVQGIIHKATQGGGFIDSKFHDHLQRARQTGMLLGAYHFGTASSADKQAYHFLNVAKQFTALENLLLVLDWEGNGDATMTFEGAEQFVRMVHRETKRYPVIYSGMSFFNDRIRGKKPADTILGKCPLWIARYSILRPALIRPWGPWSLWQYTDAGQSPGVVGRVDRNRFRGTADELAKWWKECGK